MSILCNIDANYAMTCCIPLAPMAIKDWGWDHRELAVAILCSDLGNVEERGWVLVPPGPQLLQRALPRDEEVPGGAQQPGPGVPLVEPVTGQLLVPPPPLLRHQALPHQLQLRRGRPVLAQVLYHRSLPLQLQPVWAGEHVECLTILCRDLLVLPPIQSFK